ncbi:1653_t:CDS:2, partial [Entrophospora sp. SA101]
KNKKLEEKNNLLEKGDTELKEIIENKNARIGELEQELNQEREKAEASNKIISEKES